MGPGRVGSRFCPILAGRVGSALRIFVCFSMINSLVQIFSYFQCAVLISMLLREDLEGKVPMLGNCSPGPINQAAIPTPSIVLSVRAPLDVGLMFSNVFLLHVCECMYVCVCLQTPTYPSLHPSVVVHLLPNQLNIKAVTGACKLIDGCSLELCSATPSLVSSGICHRNESQLNCMTLP